MLVTPDTGFSNISWNWLCNQRAFSAIYQNYFWKLSLFAGTILLRIWLYTHMRSLVGIVKKKTNEILRIVQSVALGVCFSILLQMIWQLKAKHEYRLFEDSRLNLIFIEYIFSWWNFDFSILVLIDNNWNLLIDVDDALMLF